MRTLTRDVASNPGSWCRPIRTASLVFFCQWSDVVAQKQVLKPGARSCQASHDSSRNYRLFLT
jgi:hypothetical protein